MVSPAADVSGLAPDRPQAGGLRVVRVPLGHLQPDPANARLHGATNLEAIQASLRRFGQAEPLVVQAGTHRLIAGHGRLAAMQALGWTEADIVEVEVTGIDAAALGIALNRTGELASWDTEALTKILDQLRTEDALDGVGYSAGDIDALLDELGRNTPRDIEDPEPEAPPVHPVSRTGDLWTLGEHRLLCGDARDPACLATLLGGRLADLVWTDPPFGCEYVGKTADRHTIANDNPRDLAPLLQRALANAHAVCRPGACWYVAAPSGPLNLLFAQVLTDLNVWRQSLVWVKNTLVLGHSDFHYRHEMLFYGWKAGAAHRAPPDRTHDTVWEVPRPTASREHATMKPVALIERALSMSSEPSDVVLDPFVGSGSTLIAAERLGRRCCALELAPAFVDVALRRWEAATGRKAALDGQTYEAVAAARGVETVS